jgi:competence protein ComEC
MAAHFIDVGQGQAILLEFSCGAALIDTGGEEDEHIDGTAMLLAYVKAFFERRPDLNNTLDVVFLTHAHGDHTSGAGLARKGPNVPQTPGLIPLTGDPPYAIRNVVTNAETTGSGSKAQNALNAYAKAHGVPHLQLTKSDFAAPAGATPLGKSGSVISPITCKHASPNFRVLTGSVPGKWPTNGNNHSLVVRLDFGQSSFLFLGDLEEDAQPKLMAAYAKNPSIFDVDVYNVAHHGSHNGTTTALVKAASPKIAVISSGDPSLAWSGLTARDFAHPNHQAIEMLSDPIEGVSLTRPAKVVPIGLKGKDIRNHIPATFDTETVDRAIYDTGWDGDITIEASVTGEEKVITSKP